MEHATFLAEIRSQSSALRAAAVEAGPDADVPTCPRWTVHRLISHHARVLAWVIRTFEDPSGQDVKAPRPPEDWNELLPWWDEKVAGVLDVLADPAREAFLPFEGYPRNASSWARRQAHEAAIHRLDAEHALTLEPSFTYQPEFAADGVDELVTIMGLHRKNWSELSFTGTVALRTADVDRAWTVKFAPGARPVVEDGWTEADLTIEGPADAVYRRVWGRPSLAVVTGDTALLEPLAAP